jgi:hypothetical protein
MQPAVAAISTVSKREAITDDFPNNFTKATKAVTRRRHHTTRFTLIVAIIARLVTPEKIVFPARVAGFFCSCDTRHFGMELC